MFQQNEEIRTRLKPEAQCQRKSEQIHTHKRKNLTPSTSFEFEVK